MDALNQSQNLSSSSQVLDSFWSPSSSSSGVHGRNSTPNYNNVSGTDATGGAAFRFLDKDEDGDDDFDPPAKKRRLTATQVQFLEKSFELENKLEPERKLRLAKELGLQPRQVAIWFQNRRARFKNKQLEKDYECLKSSFDKLQNDYDFLLKEKQDLEKQIERLKEKLTYKDSRPHQEPVFDVGIKNGSNLGLLVYKQQEASSGKSVVLDPESPIYRDGNYGFITEPADSFEPELSEEEDMLENSLGFGFPVEDQSFWLSF